MKYLSLVQNTILDNTVLKSKVSKLHPSPCLNEAVSEFNCNLKMFLVNKGTI